MGCTFDVFYKNGLCALCILMTLMVVGLGGTEVNVADDGNSGTINFKPPTLDDEHAHSLHMPDNLKCDGCRIIAYQLSEAFSKANNKKHGKRLTESEYIDAVDSVCSSKFSEYGVKEIKGVMRLSGPGMDTKDVAGIMQGGGRWPLRLQTMCAYYQGELEEDEIYEEYLENGDLETYMCYGTGVQGVCGKYPSGAKEEL